MGKIISYQLPLRVANHDKGNASNGEQAFLNKKIYCLEETFETHYAIAQREAYGEITVEDIEDPVTEPTADEKRDAQIFYTAMMTDTLLDFEEE